jgi:hypothetical protein
MRYLMMEDDEYYVWLIVMYNFVCTSWLMYLFESKDLLFVTFQQRQPSSQKAFHGLDLVK